MTNLVEMSGAAGKNTPLLSKIDIMKLNNLDAGLLALKMFSLVYPNKTIADLMKMANQPPLPEIQTMGKLSWNPLTWIPATIEGTGDALKSGGNMFSDAWRMVWDSPVGEVVEDGVRSKMGLAPTDRTLDSLISKLGAGVKGKVGGLPVWAWIGIAGAGLITIMITKKKRAPRYDY